MWLAESVSEWIQLLVAEKSQSYQQPERLPSLAFSWLTNAKQNFSNFMENINFFKVSHNNESYYWVILLSHKSSIILGLHMHVGSMGMDLSQIVQGAKQLVEFAEKINKQAGFKQITVLDVGGGVANNYHGDDDAVDFSTYKKEVIGQVPELQNYRILTEFGRSIFTKPGK